MYVVKLPRLGQTMESGVVNAWLVNEGQEFAEGEPLYEVETDKTTSEVEAKQSGRLARILVQADEDVPVGTVLALAQDVGEDLTDAMIDAFLAGEGQTDTSVPDVPDPTADSSSDISADEPTDEPEPTGVAMDSEAPAPSVDGPVRAVPKARHLAKGAGIDLASIEGSGENGVIRVADLPSSGQSSFIADYVGPPRVGERIQLRGVAKSMAEAVSRSWSEIPQFVQQTSLDATALQARLKRLRYEGLAVTYTDLIIGAVGLAAVEVPRVNSTFGDNEIIQYSDVNVSIAVASDRGLVVPVVRQANRRSIESIALKFKELATKAKTGKLTAEDTGHGTITVSNLGAFGIDSGTPLVNAPQSAIVFVGSLRDEAIVINGQIAVQPRMNIAVAYDHRVIDGMTGAQFTSALKARLEAGG